ncbi:hypothetical protein EV208_10215 [Christensenella hongkongensis]|nr:hypothetical protein EV208_10215 [Christensenella hongkongensis]
MFLFDSTFIRIPFFLFLIMGLLTLAFTINLVVIFIEYLMDLRRIKENKLWYSTHSDQVPDNNSYALNRTKKNKQYLRSLPFGVLLIISIIFIILLIYNSSLL